MLENMARIIVSIYSILFSIFLTIQAADKHKWTHRKLTTKQYGNHLAYVKAEGQTDIVHYLMSGFNEMSVLSLKTRLDGSINVTNTSTVHTITIDPPSSYLYGFGIVFNKLIEYDDTKDVANITHYSPETWKNHSTSMEITSFDNKIVFLKNVSTDNTIGNISFTFQNFADDSRQDILPHLIVTSNSTLMNVVINQMKPAFNSSRFALATSYLSQGKKAKFDIKSERSLDDEYTPGTFYVTNWKAIFGDHQSFLQWKPVCYFNDSRSTMTSTSVKSYAMRSEWDGFYLNSSLAYNFFVTENDYNITNNIISFGLAEDKFYVRNDYTAWSATLGYGVPPAEKVSTMAIAIIAVGLGIPVLLFVAGGIYLGVKRRRTGYEQVFGTISS